MFDAETFFLDHGTRFVSEGSKHCQPGWIQTACPFCTGNQGYHLGYNLKNDFFNCWRCGFHPVLEVVKTLSMTSWDKSKALMTQYRTTMSHREHLIPNKEKHKAERVIYPLGTGPLKKPHIRYLEKRGYDAYRTMEDWDLVGTGPIGPYKHRIIAPIYFNNTLVSYQGRDFTDKSDLKYKACPQEKEVIDHKRVLYGYDKVPGTSCVLVEGVTDAWRLGPGAVASFGIKTKASQILLMMEKFSRVYVMYDDDPQAIKEAEKIAYDLSMCGLYVDLCIIKGDPGGLDQRTADKYMSKLLV